MIDLWWIFFGPSSGSILAMSNTNAAQPISITISPQS